MTVGIAIAQPAVTTAQVMRQALLALALGAISSTFSLLTRFEGNGKIFRTRKTTRIALLIIGLSTIGTTAAATILPLLGKIAPVAFLPLALVVPGGLAVGGKSASRRGSADNSSTMSNVTRVLTLGISYLLCRLEDEIAEEAYQWSCRQVQNWREDGILGAADHYHEQLSSRFSTNNARCKEVDAIRDRIEDEIATTERTDDNRKKQDGLRRARTDLRIMLQRAYIWGAFDLAPYHGAQRSVITDGDVAYEVSVSYEPQSDEAAAIRPETATAKQLLELAVDLNRVGQEGDEEAVVDRLNLLSENIAKILIDMGERRSAAADTPPSDETDDGERAPGL